MVDRLTKERRSALMARVRSRNTGPELLVRSISYGLGYRHRLHRRDLPGTPDLVFPKLRCVIFVHGCFWHRHARCRKASMPKSRIEFWRQKFEKNKRRDTAAIRKLRKGGWKVLLIWECQLKNIRAVEEKMSDFLSKQPTAKKLQSN